MKEQSTNAQKEKQKANGNSKGNGATKEWLNNLGADKMVNSAQRILSTAVDVLEEEIAAGILAAKKLEKKVIDVDELRKEPEELMSRIRRDTHDAVDIFMDALTVLTNHLGNLTELVTKVKSTQPETKSAHHIPVVTNESPARAGDEVSIPLMITNDNKEQQIAIELIKADLVGNNGSKISARCIKVIPKSFLLPADQKKEVTIKIIVPATCKPGTYNGLFYDMYDAELRTVLSISVV